MRERKTYSYDKLRVTREIEPDMHNIKYEYDCMGNIIKKQYMMKDIVETTSSYKYDKLSRLIEEVHPNGDIETFTYDENGNILTHQTKTKDGNITANEKYNYSTTVKEQLISIQNATTGNIIKEFKYENSYKGNPTTIVKDGVSQNLVWEGRKLKQIGDIHFTYNEDGIRIRKQGTNFIEDYILDGSNIIGLKHSSLESNYEMYFNYDEQEEIIGVSCEGKEYFYIRDIIGNIVKIVDEDGYPVVSYTYDAWGNLRNKVVNQQCRVAYSNPFIYKGYFFDSETGWFYLKSRYYDPTIRRFINADDFNYLDNQSLNGLNLYSYCQNNPMMFSDDNGNMPKWAAWLISGIAIVSGIVLCATGVGGILGGVLIGAGAGSLINGYVTEANGGDFTAGYIGGAISGALCGVGAGPGGMAFAAASEVANLACIGYLVLGATVSFAGGFVGNLAGTVYTSWHNSGFNSVNIDWGETLATSAIMGSLNIFAGMGSAMSSIVGSMGRVATDVSSKFALRFLAGLIAGGTEAAYDLTSYLLDKLISAF